MERKQRKPREGFVSSVNFDPAVVQYLNSICEEEERSRSYVVNKIIREHAARNGKKIGPTANQEVSQEA